MRFVHAADLHLDSPLRSIALRDPDLGARLRLASRGVLSRIVDTAIARRADALVLAGDVFDGEEPDLAARAYLTAELARLAREGISTLVIRGNHDALMDLNRHGPWGRTSISSTGTRRRRRSQRSTSTDSASTHPTRARARCPAIRARRPGAATWA